MEKKKFNRLKVVLAERGKTGRELGKMIGVGDLTVSRWVTNSRQPDVETLFTISKALGVNVCDLLERDGGQIEPAGETSTPAQYPDIE